MTPCPVITPGYVWIAIFGSFHSLHINLKGRIQSHLLSTTYVSYLAASITALEYTIALQSSRVNAKQISSPHLSAQYFFDCKPSGPIGACNGGAASEAGSFFVHTSIIDELWSYYCITRYSNSFLRLVHSHSAGIWHDHWPHWRESAFAVDIWRVSRIVW